MSGENVGSRRLDVNGADRPHRCQDRGFGVFCSAPKNLDASARRLGEEPHHRAAVHRAIREHALLEPLRRQELELNRRPTTTTCQNRQWRLL